MSPQLPPLDPLLLSELRLSIMAILMQEEEADFLYLKEKTSATGGNLSVQIDKLSTAGYIEVEKGFVGKRTRTVCKITETGSQAFKDHFEALKMYFPAEGIE
ncbi:transcriptional regulator [Porphyromonas cangingivalis]|uniref:Transcriptional regulator n=1 Tax=Porphyromonas cangingivalis TaxID=36874 RepID=A0A0A2EL77_PORCN|nr:transcriptional regulator [Porphyromonas cangingivalis]KGN79703.1 transcriptional regulator [Porphyromonas cangingivalis]